MKINDKYDHFHGLQVLLSKNGMFEEIGTILEDENLIIGTHDSQYIKIEIANRFNRFGWADRVKIQKTSNLTISYVKNKIGICFQIGNVARTYADILKISYMVNHNKIDVGIIIVPDKKESIRMGANYANFERLSREMELFKEVIHFPILILSLSN